VIRYAVYNTKTGEILATGLCSRAETLARKNDGDLVAMECGPDVTDATHEVVDGQIREKAGS